MRNENALPASWRLVSLASPRTPPRPGTGWGWGGGPAVGVYIGPVMAIAIVPITMIATPMGTILAGGTVTAIGTSGSFRLDLRLAALFPPARGREGRALESRRQPIANCTAPALIFSHVLTKRLVADDGTMKSGIGFAPALFVCRPFVYFTPAQKGGCSNANSSNFDHYHRCLRGDPGAQTPLQI